MYAEEYCFLPTSDFIQVSQRNLEQAIAAAATANWTEVERYLTTIKIDRRSPPEQAQIADLSLEILARGDFQSRWDISKILPKLGDLVLPQIIEIARDPNLDLEYRWFAVRLLGNFNSQESVFAAVDLLQSETEPAEIVEMAATALATIGTAAIPALANPPTDPAQQKLAIQALAQIRHSQTIDPLIRAVESEDPEVRAIAIEALSSFHREDLLPIFQAKLTDFDPGVRKQAVLALSLQPSAGEGGVQSIAPLLWDTNLDVCLAAAAALARFQDDRSVAALGERLLTPALPASLKSQLILSLAWIANPRSIELLFLNLSAGNLENAVETIAHLGRINTEIPISKRLRQYAQTLDRSSDLLALKQVTIEALGNLGDPDSVDDLIKYLGDPDDRIKFQTIAALKKISPDLPLLIRQLSDQADLDSQLKIGVDLCVAEWS
jgi:HEAT repeat protein